MASETKQYAFASPELHWLNTYLTSSHVVKRNALMQNLLSVPANQDNRNNPNLVVAHGHSSKSSPNRKGRNIEEELVKIIGRETFSITATTAVAPLERVYIMMQCQNEMIKAGRLSTPYKGMTDCFLRTIRHEGVRSLWRGNSLNVTAVCAGQAYLFCNIIPCKSYMSTKVKESRLWSLPFIVMPIMLWHYPLDFARVRLATDVKADVKAKFSLDFSRNIFGKRQFKFNGVIDVYKKTLQFDGIHGLYRGFSASFIAFFAHDHMNLWFKPTSGKETHNQKTQKMLDLMVKRCIVHSVPIILYPLDTVSRRMMMTSGEASKYRGAMDAFYQIVKTEGVSSLFKGVTPFVIRNIAFDLVYVGIRSMTLLVLQTLAEW